jgi:3-oxoacyl-[acyl-carrier protein] reductase
LSAERSWVVVTGAGGALGQALVAHFVAAGRSVLAVDAVGERLAAIPSSPFLVTSAVDLSDATALQGALDAAIPRAEPIRLLVNAVGLIWNEPLLALKGARFSLHQVESFERVVRANLTTTFVAATRVAARMVRSGGGAIINFSSISAGGNTGQVAYSSAKAGIEGMTRSMARELGPLGVRVNAIAPGFIDVPSTREALTEPVVADYARRTPLARLGTLDELIAAVDALAANGFMNGVVLPLDGGLKL